ncbi:MAG: dienelactone hydrolase family protein [Chitinophagia bacterium]
MKKLLLLLLLVSVTATWTSWRSQQHPEAMIQKKEIISCMETETMEAYFAEASQNAFGQMHLSPVKVDAADLMGKMIQFNTADGKQASGYYIAPKKKSKKWLIVIQEWWGLNENIKLEADKYFKDLGNFNVLAVDMYDGKVAATPDSAMKISRGADPVRMTTILQGAMQHAGKDASIYSVGWCFGGMWSLQTAIIAGSQAKGTIMFYGRPETNLDKLKTIQCDILGFFGNLDRSPSPAMVSDFEKNMETAGKKLTTHKYEAGHGFANPSNPSFNKEATEDSYTKAIAFLKTH